jgi:MFS superfamily sulfate permease-like transporter
MAAPQPKVKGFRFPVLQGISPLNPAQMPADLMAGITLAALNIPQALGYTKIAGTPVITCCTTLLGRS